MKKLLVILSSSQTGQLHAVTDSVLAPLRNAPGISLTEVKIEPETPFPFPWPFIRFFNTFPETVYEDVSPVKPLPINPDDDYDVIILAYQVWFLSPSQPTMAFLQSPEARRLIKGKPVVTLIACRNMWLMAQERVKEIIRELGGRLVDNIVLTDTAHSAATFISTPLWMLTGRRGPFLGGLVPAAGITPAEIAAAGRFGRALAESIPGRAASDDSPMLSGLKAVHVNERLIASEKIAKRSFRIWGALLRKVGPPESPLRKLVLIFYITFLVTLILTVVPVSAVLKRLLAPLFKERVAQQRAYYSAPSGEGDERMVKFS